MQNNIKLAVALFLTLILSFVLSGALTLTSPVLSDGKAVIVAISGVFIIGSLVMLKDAVYEATSNSMLTHIVSAIIPFSFAIKSGNLNVFIVMLLCWLISLVVFLVLSFITANGIMSKFN